MSKGNKKVIIHLLIAGFLLSTFFGCILVAKESFMVHDHDSTAMMTCCDSEGIFGATGHDIPMILGSNTNLQLLLLILAIVYLFIKDNSQIREHVLKHYFRTRDRYGGFKLFYYFTALLSRGILHPKIY